MSTTQPIKGAGTTLWIYTGSGDPYANPLSDVDWTRLAKIKTLEPGEMTADSYDDTYLDDEDADWSNTAQGVKSAGNTSFTLAWKPGEAGQKDLVEWYTSGDARGYKIRYPNGVVDVFKGWISSLGKAIPAAEVITRTAQVTNTGKPALAEESTNVIPVVGITAVPSVAELEVGKSVNITFSVMPLDASDNTFRVASSDQSKATVILDGNVAMVQGLSVGTVQIIAMTSDGQHVAIATVTITAP